MDAPRSNGAAMRSQKHLISITIHRMVLENLILRTITRQPQYLDLGIPMRTTLIILNKVMDFHALITHHEHIYTIENMLQNSSFVAIPSRLVLDSGM